MLHAIFSWQHRNNVHFKLHSQELSCWADLSLASFRREIFRWTKKKFLSRGSKSTLALSCNTLIVYQENYQNQSSSLLLHVLGLDVSIKIDCTIFYLASITILGHNIITFLIDMKDILTVLLAKNLSKIIISLLLFLNIWGDSGHIT